MCLMSNSIACDIIARHQSKATTFPCPKRPVLRHQFPDWVASCARNLLTGLTSRGSRQDIPAQPCGHTRHNTAYQPLRTQRLRQCSSRRALRRGALDVVEPVGGAVLARESVPRPVPRPRITSSAPARWSGGWLSQIDAHPSMTLHHTPTTGPWKPGPKSFFRSENHAHQRNSEGGWSLWRVSLGSIWYRLSSCGATSTTPTSSSGR